MKNVPKGTSTVLTLLIYLKSLKPLSKRDIQRHARCRPYASGFESALAGDSGIREQLDKFPLRIITVEVGRAATYSIGLRN